MFPLGFDRDNSFAIRLILSALEQESPNDFAEREIRRMRCEWCKIGLPIEDGIHKFFGLEIKCDAFDEFMHNRPRKYKYNNDSQVKGRGISKIK